ncbi:hypothetical protein PC129_g21355 [Phytophthora cactorum]|uniref:Uncharacterized protein n=1 Tax=Phytophthora cactorum TaxID=29920 RepID=A0A329SS40_9STRA|nr:hypothetical protein Pcac1_g3366 [Phytophthora cactorum]KAG2791879.1 hypothetical protein PC112_g24080 [Phytophthora cactorum]KAG2796194.1 hypothetical protein PC111_g21832 [Phytophthora cactorum]KAG2808626.1 hypothetical protein PC113_g23941 [Phytophthora cactorum]KAG2875480.1 hypothetical protein PC114_g24699 [Phytophthora cactorum]
MVLFAWERVTALTLAAPEDYYRFAAVRRFDIGEVSGGHSEIGTHSGRDFDTGPSSAVVGGWTNDREFDFCFS